MAKLTYTGTPPVNRRHGIVYSPQRTLQTARAMAVPLQPLANLQSISQASFASAAQVWSTYSPAIQEGFNTNAPEGLSGYAWFMQAAQLAQTWGVPSDRWVVLANQGPNWGASGIAWAQIINGRVIYTFYADIALVDPATCYAQLYIDPSGVIPRWGTEASGGPALNVPTPQTLVYWGYMGPVVPGALMQADVTDAINAATGGQELPFRVGWPQQGYQGGSVLQASLSFSTSFGQFALYEPFPDALYTQWPYPASWDVPVPPDTGLPIYTCAFTQRLPNGYPPPMTP